MVNSRSGQHGRTVQRNAITVLAGEQEHATGHVQIPNQNMGEMIVLVTVLQARSAMFFGVQVSTKLIYPFFHSRGLFTRYHCVRIGLSFLYSLNSS